MPLTTHDDPRFDGDSKPSPDSSPSPHPSQRVQLEVDLLTSIASPPFAPEPPRDDEPERRRVLVVSRDADLRRYVHECLLSVEALQLVDAPSTAAALEAARVHVLHLVIVDAFEQALTASLPDVPAIVVADALAPTSTGESVAHAPRIAMRPPFSVQALVQHVRQLLA